ncbi:MAG TPA: ClbS/DfsB family four-helix bundle protein [Vicinamibacterales bacterium]|nr:ClbS/DfsB family four-helix bundle protein [Vicinamibacterales bacterium]
MRFTSKHELVDAIEREHRTLIELVRMIPTSRYREPGVWGDRWTIKDLLAHLTEWEQMFLTWYRAGCAGVDPVLPAPGFKWNETPKLNRAIRRKHLHKSVSRVRGEFEESYLEIRALVERLSEDELLVPGFFAWTGRHPLATYLGPNACSHYRFGAKVVRRWLRKQSGARRRTAPATIRAGV